MSEEIPFVDGIKKTKREHPGYARYFQMNEKIKAMMPNMFGQWQYFYSNEKGEIDAVYLPNHLMDGRSFWEIFSEGKLFDDVERFYTLEEAEERVKELLL